jgi:hypothetical protein
MESKVDFISLMHNAETTVNWAKIIPATTNTNFMPCSSIAEPRGVLKKTRRAAPRAIGDMTMGRSGIVSTTLLPLNSVLDMA